MSLSYVTLKGYVLPKNTSSKAENAGLGEEEEEEGDEEEEEKQPEFLDIKEINSVSSGGYMFNSSAPVKTEVDFHDLESGKLFRVEGRFALRSPWWEVTCTAVSQKKKMILKSYPSYRLRTDLDTDEWRSVVSLFLKACNVQPEFAAQFFEWVQDRDVSISNVMNLLTEFEEGARGVAQSIKGGVFQSVEWMRVEAASLYPLLMKYLPTLLPAHFVELLDTGKNSKKQPTTQFTQDTQHNVGDEEKEEDEVDLSLLARLEEIIKTNSWKLGFNYVMYKELKLVRCEAQLAAFEDSGLLQKIPLLQRNALRVYDQLKAHCHRMGSTYVELQTLCEELSRKDGIADEEAWNAVQFLKELGVVVRERKKVALQNYYVYETGIAKCLRCLVEAEPWQIPLDARQVLLAAELERQKKNKLNVDGPHEDHGATDLPPIKLDPDQVQAAQMICANPLTVISGKGGCGKTTVVSLIFKAALEQQDCESVEVKSACADYENDCGESQSWDDPPQSPSLLSQAEGNVTEKEKGIFKGEKEILLTAPTGRAASLLTKKTSFTAYTLHQVLWSFQHLKKDSSGAQQKWKFASVRVLVVDEGSLVCVQLLHTILTMLTRHAQLRKFIILGDIRQLPSIQPGNTLNDLFHSLKPSHWAIEMKTNHRAESELIVNNAGLVADMGMKHRYRDLHFDFVVDVSKDPPTMPSADKRFILILLPNEDDALQKAVTALLCSAPGLKEDAKSQFIAFKRIECALINELCCKHYCNHITKDHRKRVVFQPGDKVCCTKNGYIQDAGKTPPSGMDLCEVNTSSSNDEKTKQKEEKDKDKLRLCNGEIFFIKEDTTKEEQGKRKTRYLTLDDCDGRMLTVSFRDVMRDCRLQHAWARTIHTFQGSEAETVVYVLGNGGGQNWKHVYTAVTRGQKRVYMVAKKEGLVSAIQRHIIPRNTRLKGLVRELFAPPGTEEPLSQPATQPQPGTPCRASTSFGHAQSTPLPSQTPSSSQAPSAHSTPLLPKRLWGVKAAEADAADVSLLEDVAFSEAYSWPSMSSSEERPAEQLVAEENLPVEGYCAVDEGALIIGCSPSKRMSSSVEMGTPSKQRKGASFHNRLQELALSTPKRPAVSEKDTGSE